MTNLQYLTNLITWATNCCILHKPINREEKTSKINQQIYRTLNSFAIKGSILFSHFSIRSPIWRYATNINVNKCAKWRKVEKTPSKILDLMQL